MSCETHVIHLSSGQDSALCDNCGEDVRVTLDEDGSWMDGNNLLPKGFDISHFMPNELVENEYIPDVLFELLQHDRCGWPVHSPVLADLLDRLPRPWLHQIASLGLTILMVSLNPDRFRLTSDGCLLALTSMEDEDDIELTDEMVQKAMDEVESELEESSAKEERNISLLGVEKRVSKLTEELKAKIKELDECRSRWRLLETEELSDKIKELDECRSRWRLLEMEREELSESMRSATFQARRLQKSNVQAIERREIAQTSLMDSSKQVVMLTAERLERQLQIEQNETSTMLEKLERIRDKYKADKGQFPLLETSLGKWKMYSERFPPLLDELRNARDSEIKAIEEERIINEINSLSSFTFDFETMKPMTPNFAEINREIAKDTQKSPVSRLTRKMTNSSNSLQSAFSNSDLASSDSSGATAAVEDADSRILEKVSTIIPNADEKQLRGIMKRIRCVTKRPLSDDDMARMILEEWFPS